ncbi:MAG: response regulator [Verrucomicrobia bacterium]|nr:response regulator [Verrucomicrobiota bacterium]
MKKIRTVLIVEDTEDDAFLLKRALAKAGFPSEQVHLLQNGKEAQDYLEGTGPYVDRKKFPYPDIIFTDLKMPVMNGFELLRWIKANPVYQVIPTIVLSSSKDKLDVKRSFMEGANCYFMKPHSQEENVEMLKLIFNFWNKNELPEI